MSAPEPKCAHCKGWAFEPGVTPMAVCSQGGGTGRPRRGAQAQLGETSRG